MEQSNNQHSSSKTPLFVVIFILSLLLVGGGVGIGVYFLTKPSEEDLKLKELTEKIDELEEKNIELNEQIENADENSVVSNIPQQKTIVKKHAKNAAAHRAVSAGGSSVSSGVAKVVVNGTGVRLRFGPSLYSGYLVWENGATRSPKKGTRLTLLGETDDWYRVEYLGREFYISKEFSYLEY